ncbi:MAG TPA: hypothetical protein VFF68_08945 [Anaerolineaceae bacterium]|nr:hypothetical protein [Anaerolineaceae bacterium]
MKRKILAGLLVPAAMAVIILFGVTYNSVSAAPEQQGPGWGIELGAGMIDEYLAEALGISVEELESAYQSATDAALDQAVEAGLITQAQADQIRERGGGFHFGRMGGWLAAGEIDFNALLADALGISVDELNAAYAQAHLARIEQAVADGALSEEEAELLRGHFALNQDEGFQSAMRTAFEDAVYQAVENGVITQAQADQILANAEGMRFGGFGMRGGMGGRMGGFDGMHGFGRRGGMRFGAPWLDPVPTNPTVEPSSGL